MRHRRRGAASGELDFRDLVLRQYRDVLPNLAERPGNQRQPTSKFRQTVSLDLPARPIIELEQTRQLGRNRISAALEAATHADRSSELNDQKTLSQLGKAAAVPVERFAPAANLVSRVDRQSPLHSGASHQSSCSLLRLDRPQERNYRVEPRRKGPDKGLQSQNETCV